MTDAPPVTRRVLFLDSVPFIGGAENSMLELATRLPDAGYCPHLACPEEGPLLERGRERGVASEAVELAGTNLAVRRRLPAAILAVRSLIRRRGIDLVHINSLPLVHLAPFAARLAGRPCILHVRDLVPKDWARGRARFGLGLCRRVLCISRAVHAPLAGLGDRAQVLYNGVDVEAFALVPPPEERPVTIGIVGYLIPRKGHEDLLRAARLLVEEGVPDFHLRVFGKDPSPDGGTLRRLRQLAEELRLTQRVEFAGFHSDLSALYAGLDIVVMPSWEEPFGRVLIEAMAAGRPTVACATGGVPEITVEGETGLMVPPRDPPALAAALGHLVRDPGLRRRMGEAGRRRAEAVFSIRAHVQRVVHTYAEVLRQ